MIYWYLHQERCAYTTSDDWAIFALHNQYVRPLRDREWVPGEPCIIRKNCFELPPGACECDSVHKISRVRVEDCGGRYWYFHISILASNKSRATAKSLRESVCFGAGRFSEVSCGIPATAFDSFVFPNPPRQFLISSSRRTSGNVDFAQPSFVRSGRARGGARGGGSQLTQQQLLDLER